MKIIEMSEKINMEFRGLANCNAGLVWLIADDGAVCIGSPSLVYDLEEWSRAFDNQGPFTKYNGQLVLEND